MEWAYGEFKISTDKSLLSLEKIKDFLSKSYWADNRPINVIKKSIQNSDCYGVYHGNEQIGFARVVTDYATVYWICDVFIDERYRGKGLGKALIERIVESGDLKGVRGILGTKDAHRLYEQFGFERLEGRFMKRMP